MKKHLLTLLAMLIGLSSQCFAQLNSIYMSDYVWNANATFGMPYVSPKDILEQQKQLEQQKKIKNVKVEELKIVEESIDKATGITTIRWEDGSSYVGHISHKKFNGVGTMKYADGSVYCGQWWYGNPDGQGTFINPEGVKYTAKFERGVPHGKCIIQDVDGRLYKGRWVNGVLKNRTIKPLKKR